MPQPLPRGRDGWSREDGSGSYKDQRSHCHVRDAAGYERRVEIVEARWGIMNGEVSSTDTPQIKYWIEGTTMVALIHMLSPVLSF